MGTDNDTNYDTNNDNDKTFLLSEKPKLYRLYTWLYSKIHSLLCVTLQSV